MESEAVAAPSLGRRVSERYSRRWMASGAPRIAIGRLAGSAAAFGGLVGRPLSTRRALTESFPAPAPGTDRLPVGVPPVQHLAAWWSLAATEELAGRPSRRGVPGRRDVPRRGLPRAVARRMQSPAGEATGPTGAVRRMAQEEIAVRRPSDVRAAGPMLSNREAGRTPRIPAPRQAAGAEDDTAGPPVRRLDLLRATVLAQRADRQDHAAAQAGAGSRPGHRHPQEARPPGPAESLSGPGRRLPAGPHQPAARSWRPAGGPESPIRASPGLPQATDLVIPLRLEPPAVGSPAAPRLDETIRRHDAYRAQAAEARRRWVGVTEASARPAPWVRPDQSGNWMPKPPPMGVGRRDDEPAARPSPAGRDAPAPAPAPAAATTAARPRAPVARPAAQPSGSAPAQSSGSAPAQSSGSAPAQSSGSAPARSSGSPSALSPGSAPAQPPGSPAARSPGAVAAPDAGGPSVAAAGAAGQPARAGASGPSAAEGHGPVPDGVEPGGSMGPSSTHAPGAAGSAPAGEPVEAGAFAVGRGPLVAGLPGAPRPTRGGRRPLRPHLLSTALPRGVARLGAPGPVQTGEAVPLRIGTPGPPHGILISVAAAGVAGETARPGSLLGQPGGDRAGRFTQVLRQHRPDPEAALPQHIQPLVTAIVGTAAVRMRIGPAARAALAAAGRPAATVGRVIHLDAPPDRSPHSTGLLAHELVHAARPDPQPRFFGDDRAGPEEALAHATGGLVRTLTARTPADAPRPFGPPGPAGVGGAAAVLRSFAAAGPTSDGALAAAVRAATGAGRSAGSGAAFTPGAATAPAAPAATGAGPLAGGGQAVAPGAATAPAAPAVVQRNTSPTAGDRHRGAPVRGASGMTWGTDGLAVAAGAHMVAPGWAQRSAAPPVPAPSPIRRSLEPAAGATVVVGTLLERTAGLLAQRAGAGIPPTVAGTASASGFPDPYHPLPGDPPVIRRLAASGSQAQPGGPSMDPSSHPVEQSPAPLSAEALETIIDALEQRVIEELERRGWRHNPGVF